MVDLIIFRSFAPDIDAEVFDDDELDNDNDDDGTDCAEEDEDEAGWILVIVSVAELADRKEELAEGCKLSSIGGTVDTGIGSATTTIAQSINFMSWKVLVQDSFTTESPKT